MLFLLDVVGRCWLLMTCLTLVRCCFLLLFVLVVFLLLVVVGWECVLFGLLLVVRRCGWSINVVRGCCCCLLLCLSMFVVVGWCYCLCVVCCYYFCYLCVLLLVVACRCALTGLLLFRWCCWLSLFGYRLCVAGFMVCLRCWLSLFC